ncbi:LysM peptidoglycan-binding domain-containing protein [Jatrophihabitans fulvus]
MVTVRFAALASADAAVLALATSDVSALGRGLAHPRTWLAETGADHVTVTVGSAALWLVAVWVAAGLVAVVAAGLPGAAGRWAQSVAEVALPAAVRRMVAGSVGLGVLLAPVAAGARTPEHPGAAGNPAGRPAAQVAMDGSRTGASSGLAAPRAIPPTPPPVPGPAWPSGTGHTPPGAPPTTPHHPQHPHSPTRTPPAGASASSHVVTVRPGQCLWSIAEHRLDTHDARAVAPFVQRLYAANRAVVGADPDHVVPGQVLHLPTAPEGDR